jgi:glycogen debranching enzyme
MTDEVMSPWAPTAQDTSVPTVNLVEGTCFVVSGRDGVIGRAAGDGLYVFDTRALSRWRVQIPQWSVEPLSFVANGPFSGTFVSRAVQDRRLDAPIVVLQRRSVGRGMLEEIEIRNHGPAVRLAVRLEVATDLAGLFEVKSGRSAPHVTAHATDDRRGLRLTGTGTTSTIDAVVVRSSVALDDVDTAAGSMCWEVGLEPGQHWSTCIEVSTVVRRTHVPPAHRCDEPIATAIPVERWMTWQHTTPEVDSDDVALVRAVERAIDDLGALRIFDPDHTDRVVVAAGAPWFMALFGRDSILSSWMALPFDRSLARGVLSELADHQGTVVDPRTEEQPGRILHEVRFDRTSAELLGDAGVYYGSIDSTPLFVMLAAELARWTGMTDDVGALMPAVDRAIAWMEQSGDRDGDGFVEYARSDPAGLEHQGWKDSWDGIRHADGSTAAPPIALCEVQAYCYGAYRGRAALGRMAGEAAERCDEFERRATELAERFDEAFWLDDVGTYALGLDEAKRPIRSSASNVGHLLWTGIVPPDKARRVARRLVSPAMFSGWGVRTLAADHPAYNPLSYHCGSVWPHDTAIAVAGLARYGFDREAHLVARALLDAAAVGDWRLPELFAGFARDDISVPVPYPSSCSPQAWAAAAPLLIVRAVLGLEVDVAAGTVRLRPRLPSGMTRLALRGVALGGELVDVVVDRDGAEIRGSSFDVEVS